MNDEFDAVAVIAASGTIASAAGTWYWFMDLSWIIPVIVGGLLTAILVYRRANRANRFPRQGKTRGR